MKICYALVQMNRIQIKRLLIAMLLVGLTTGMFPLPNPTQAASLLVTTRNDSGTGSLRNAILTANKTSEMDIIQFRILDDCKDGICTINVIQPLPEITAPVSIDGTTQINCSVPCIEINGAKAETYSSGLVISAGSSTLQGLAIISFAEYGLVLKGNGNNRIAGNVIGLNSQGTIINGNLKSGILIENSANNSIGGSNTADRNVISGNMGAGVLIMGSASSQNTIAGNIIGLNSSGTLALGNGLSGVAIESSGYNTIGGDSATERNVISGNNGAGILLKGASSTQNIIAGNIIGLNSSGSTALGNGLDGIIIDSAPANLVVQISPDGLPNIISGNLKSGIRITGSGASGNLVGGNVIGADEAMKTAVGNHEDGVTVENAADNVIGDGTPEHFNMVVGNLQAGIRLSGANAVNNLIQGNDIGFNLYHNISWFLDLGNEGAGIELENAIGNTVHKNRITGNEGSGILIHGASASLNTVTANESGGKVLSQISLGNTQNGITLRDGAHHNQIGGEGSGDGNQFLANAQSGIEISGDQSGFNNIIGNIISRNSLHGVWLHGAPGTRIGGPTIGESNTISANGDIGILVEGTTTTNTVIQGNRIGIGDITTSPGNSVSGIRLSETQEVLIGGENSGEGNLIGNSPYGIDITYSFTTTIAGNTIGLNENGELQPNGDGIRLFESSGNIVGGSKSGRNVISGNYTGIRIDVDEFDGKSWYNAISYNYIGLDSTGMQARPNEFGVIIVSCYNTIGPGNVISGNHTLGMYVLGYTVYENVIKGNIVGLNAEGTLAVGNRSGISMYGNNNIIGGENPSDGNVISGNDFTGLVLNTSATGNRVMNNIIGPSIDGRPGVGNHQAGISIFTSNNMVGGMGGENGNWVAYNLSSGIDVLGCVMGECYINNALLSNRINGNGGLGIDLNADGVTPINAGGPFTGANRLQNYPLLDPVDNQNGYLHVSGILNSIPDTTFTIQFFADPECDPSGYGEGHTYLGETFIESNQGGEGWFNLDLPLVLNTIYVTATATDPNGNTSEFSPCAIVTSFSLFLPLLR